jgi:hypothetical protein
MMELSRIRGVIPNYTCHGLDVTPEIAARTASLCGAVAVSIVDKEKTYDAVKMFTDAGMTQVNIHFMLAQETYDRAFEIIRDIKTDPRLAKLNAVVFLQYKPKGRGHYTSVTLDQFKELLDACNEAQVGYGFDSCSAPMFFKTSTDNHTLAEPCESFGMFSSYINCHGIYYPCSFCEGEGIEGIDVLHCENFLKEVWYSDTINEWRERMSKPLNCECEHVPICRACPIFDITPCKRRE